MSPENGDRDPVFGGSSGSAAALASLASGRDGSSRGVSRIIHRSRILDLSCIMLQFSVEDSLTH